MENCIWVTWEDQRRNKTLSQALDVELCQLDVNLHRVIRYPYLIFRTLFIYLVKKPEIIFAQNPSIVLALVTVVFGRVFRKKVVIDAHNAGVYPFEGCSSLATRVSLFLFRNAFLTIVTNDSLRAYVEGKGGKSFTLPDPFPEISSKFPGKELKGQVNFLLICTWAGDEPYEEVIRAFSRLDTDMVLYVTGNSKGREKKPGLRIPDNVILTGFLSSSEFDQMLNSCDVVIDLTTREDCLVCGAYEAVAAGKPSILSDTNALREYFKDAATYTENTVESIVQAVAEVKRDLPAAILRVQEYRSAQEKEWDKLKNDLVSQLK